MQSRTRTNTEQIYRMPLEDPSVIVVFFMVRTSLPFRALAFLPRRDDDGRGASFS